MDETGAIQISFLDELGEVNVADAEENSSSEPVMYNPKENLYAHVYDRFERAKNDRHVRENIDLQSWHNFRGEYYGEQKRNLEEAKSRDPAAADHFVKITKTKVLAAYGQLLEILEGDGKFPLQISRTLVPDGVPDKVFVEKDSTEYKADQIIDVYGYAGDGQELEKGATHKSLLDKALKNFKPFFEGKTVKAGRSPDPTTVMEFDPAEMAAVKMNRMIHDQLMESSALRHLEDCAFENAVFGTGILKGPFTHRIEVPDWQFDEDQGRMIYKPKFRLAPKISWVSKWNFYPDPTAKTIDDCEFVIERHILNAPQIRKLADQPGFDAEAVFELLESTPLYEREDWEEALHDDNTNTETYRYEVLEFWGYIDEELATALGLEVSDVNQHHVMVNAWVSRNQVLKLSLNPLQPKRFPYHAVPFEKHAYQIWGVGVAENMEDSQKLMNTHMRLGIDNLRLSGSAIFEVDESIIAANQDMAIYPGKIFYRQEGAIGQGISDIKFNNNAGAHIQMYDKARQLADEKTGIPSYSHGQTGVSGTTRTASGMSMLMGAATLSTKTVVKNWDAMLERLGEMLFAWNMQFNNELPEEMRHITMGDLKVKASGTTAFMQREVRSQRILQLMQVMAQNPLFNMQNALKELAKALDLDPEDFLNDPQSAALYAELLQKAQQNGTQTGQAAMPEAATAAAPGGRAGAQGSSGGTDPSDPTGAGGGTIGTGVAPGPGENGFSINA